MRDVRRMNIPTEVAEGGGGRACWSQLRRQQKSVGIFQYNPCTDLSIEWEVVEYHGTDEGDLTGLGEQGLLLIYGFSD
jgi:hypothetical protein